MQWLAARAQWAEGTHLPPALLEVRRGQHICVIAAFN